MGNALRLGIARVGLAFNKWRTERKQSKRQITILILGLQATGKSTVAQRLSKPRKALPDPAYVQTKGFNTIEIRKKKLTIRLHDIGGHCSIRELWTHYYPDAHGIIYVVDSSKPEDMVEAGEVLAEVLRDERMRRKPVLLLANKQDVAGAVSETEMTRSMDLVTTVNSARCLTRIDVCAANNLKMDQGIFNGFKWLLSYIEIHYSELNERVQEDSAIEMEREKVLFNLRRSARQAEEEVPTMQANGSIVNNNQRQADDEEEDGIDQVQKPRDLCSMSFDTENDPGDLPTRPKPLSGISERQSPEGAADSSEDLKKQTTDAAKPSSSTSLPPPDPNAAQNGNSLATANQHQPIELKNGTVKPTPASITGAGGSGQGESRKDPAVGLLKSAKRGNRVSPAISSTDTSGRNIPLVPLNHSQAESKTVNGLANGVDNPAFEPNADDQDSQVQITKPTLRKFSVSQIPVRTSAFSIRSNSTETDVDGPAEIIMVTTKAEVHKSQEIIDDFTYNPGDTRPSSRRSTVDKPLDTFNFANPENTHEHIQSPTLSYLSGGHISHKTSLDSMNSDVHYRIDPPQATPKSSSHRSNSNHANINRPLSRSSSATYLNESSFHHQELTLQVKALAPSPRHPSSKNHRNHIISLPSKNENATNANLPALALTHSTHSNGMTVNSSEK